MCERMYRKRILIVFLSTFCKIPTNKDLYGCFIFSTTISQWLAVVVDNDSVRMA